MAILDDFVSGAQQFDEALRTVKSRGAEVVALGAAVALPVRVTDLPINPFFAAIVVNAQIFPPSQVPNWLADIPIQDVPDWRSP